MVLFPTLAIFNAKCFSHGLAVNTGGLQTAHVVM